METAELIKQGVLLVHGLALRYGLSCAAWTGLRMLRDAASRRLRPARDPDVDAAKRRERRKRDLRMWGCSMGAEVAVSLLLVPGRYLVGKSVHRLMFDFMMPALSDLLCKFDRFNPSRFLGFSADRTTPAEGAEWDLSFFVWHLPATLLTFGKLFYRMHTVGRKNTKAWRCIGVTLVQYIARVMMVTFSTWLPMSENELVFCLLLLGIDKTTDAYLIRNTWPGW
jgi:hypothetical protein